MNIKLSETTPLQLDWLVELAKGTHWSPNGYFCFDNPKRYDKNPEWRYSTDWAQGGPIIERERISTLFYTESNYWVAVRRIGPPPAELVHRGHTPLIAAMRCYCASKLGDAVEVPDELSVA